MITAPDRDAGQDLLVEDALATKILMALLRLSQQSRLYDADNEAQRRVFDEIAKLSAEYGHKTGRNITIFVSERAAYVGRRLLRANRSVYAAAAQLRAVLAPLGATQITIGYDVPLSDLKTLQAAFRVAQQDPNAARPPRELARIRLMIGRPPGELAELDGLTAEDRAIKVYTLAIVILRRFFAQLQAGDVAIPGHMRHIALHLAELSRTASPAFLQATVARPAHDDAARAVGTALLSACMARLLQTETRMLERLAMAALLCDVGRPRVAGMQPMGEARRGGQLPALADHMLEELPRATAVVTTALGKMTDAGIARSVLVYEALHLAHAQETGAAYRGRRAPATLARIIARSRTFQEALARGASPSDGLAAVVRGCTDDSDRSVAELMMATLCIFPTGTEVELSNGRRARVVATSDRDIGRPVVSLLDGEVAALVDLGAREHATLDVVRVLSLGAQVSGASTSANQHETAKPPARARAMGDVQIPGAPRSPNLERDDNLYIMVGPSESSGPPPSLTSVPPPSTRIAAAVPLTIPPASKSLPSQSLHPPVAATAEGSLAKTPVPMLLLFMLEHRLTGTLTLTSEEHGRCAIYFQRGEPSNVRTPKIVSPLGPLLVRMGLITREQLGAGLRAVASSKQLLGRYLISRKVVTQDALRSALNQQLINKIAYTMQFEPATRYAFYDDVDLLADYGGAELASCEPLALVTMGVRGFISDEQIAEVLNPLGARSLDLHADAEPDRLGFTDAERPVVQRLVRGPATLAELLTCTDETAARHALYALIVTRCIDLSNGTRAPVGHSPPSVE